MIINITKQTYEPKTTNQQANEEYQRSKLVKFNM